MNKIDTVNQAMLGFLFADMKFYMVNGRECINYPYSDKAQEKSPDHSEDFLHGSLDSRDFQIFYKNGRYTFDKRYVESIANTVVEVVYKGNGEFAESLNGTGSQKWNSVISYDGYIWYAGFRPEIRSIIIDHIINKNIAYKNGIYDAYCLFEILKLKD